MTFTGVMANYSMRRGICVIAVLLTFCKELYASDFYCSDVHDIIDVNAGRLITRAAGTVNYDNNLQCLWVITATDVSKVIHVKVESSHLQWSPMGAICVGYDYVQVQDGASPDSREIVTWCGESNPRSFTSSGPELRIKFVSNDRNQSPFSGVTMSFTVLQERLGLGACPPGWHDDPSQGDGGESCYILRTRPETWTKAQSYCNYDQANLVSVNSEEEDSAIYDLLTNSALGEYDRVWISLNDIEVDGQYHWLDGSKSDLDKWDSSSHEPEAYYNCVQMNKHGRWCEDFCNEDEIQTTVRHQFICEKAKVGGNELYRIPSTRTNKGGEKTSTPQQTRVILGVLVALAVVIVIVIVVIVVCVKRKKKHKASWKHSPPHSQTQSSARPAQGSSLTTQSRPPPTAPTASTSDINALPPTVVVIHTFEPPPSYESVSQSTPISTSAL